ncbi:L-rhamnose isomerase [Butyrivibrio sp. INlla16]|nr:L-rhamnose isomerase [Butyrivibrio sp. INlla16]SDB23748.1 L-rhamnose isomerase [Butyrivibrio sp. INlla16]
MIVKERYEAAKERYAKLGVDTDKAISELEKISLSMHCWQGDDVVGFDQKGPLSGGIQTTGNYPYKATTPEQLMQDIDEVFTLVPGKHKLNLHACYAVFEGDEWVDRDKLEPKHFKAWVDFAKKHGIGLDFNPTMFSHPMAENATLSSEDETVRKFWVDHCIACLKMGDGYRVPRCIP